MSEDGLEQGDTTFDEIAAKRAAGPSKRLLLFMALAGAGAGAWFGGPLVTPMVAEVVASRASGSEGGGGYGGHGGGYGDEGASDEPLLIDGLVLNPAESGGSRFLVASLALDTSPEAASELASRDAEARDLLLTILSAKTVDELSDVSRRDEIREDLRAALNTMLGYDGVHRIFLPQFVIQ